MQFFYHQAYKFKPECVSCPYSHLLSWMNSQVPIREAFARVTAQIFGGMFFFWIQCHIWDFGLTKIHLGRSDLMSYGHCYTWLSVPTGMGFLVECGGAFVISVLGIFIFDFTLWPGANLHIRILFQTGLTVAIVLMGFYRTGGFFQPLLAFMRTFGCEGVMRKVGILDHIFVYWVGPSFGAVMAKLLSSWVKGQKEKNTGTCNFCPLFCRKNYVDD